MQNLPKTETVEQAREVLLGMDGEQEITAELDGWRASIKKHNDREYSAFFPDQETGVISLRDAFPHPARTRGPRPLLRLSQET